MENLIIEQTKSTPYIFFCAETGKLRIEGESYPENVIKFYTPVLEWLHDYFIMNVKDMVLEFKIIYFNSSTSKVFLTIFDLLEQKASTGCNITVKWICDKDNDVAIECGEEFQEEINKFLFTVEIC
ncbi:MAG: DUF1987 domain-containing protein [Megasphaera sp.]|jgi:hypothetical protein|uniref:DUF1987 domain-containing protein n=1 Tax=Megasphaera sueciensis TaxID=349094 RepID=UPI003CFEE533|nr:DUF1987 domain-containing protein [Megasphaera sp.]MCI1822402.1 DUF1987 domain-containing protein [Megasphaera sp.]